MPTGRYIEGEERIIYLDNISVGGVSELGILIWSKMEWGGGARKGLSVEYDVTHQEDWTGLSVLDDGDSSDILIGLLSLTLCTKTEKSS